MRTCTMKDGDEICGRPVYTEHGSECEKHYARKYPVTYARLKREIPCPECGGVGTKTNLQTERTVDCEICDHRGWIDPERTVLPPRALPPQEEPHHGKVFDPGVH